MDRAATDVIDNEFCARLAEAREGEARVLLRTATAAVLAVVGAVVLMIGGG